jgi:hypothetical protein
MKHEVNISREELLGSINPPKQVSRRGFYSVLELGKSGGSKSKIWHCAVIF